MNSRCRQLVLALVMVMVVFGASSLAFAAEALQPSLEAFKLRHELVKKQLPLITQAAEAAAKRTIEHPGLLVNVPYAEQKAFAEDIVNRSGGLANALPYWDRRDQSTPHDILLYSVRSWPTDGAKFMKTLTDHMARGWLTVLFASKVGMPEDLKPDFFIDNGATVPGDEEAAVNALVNVYQGWLWCVEYSAALTRLGVRPGILQSMVTPGADEHNNIYQAKENRIKVYDTNEKIPAGVLGGLYIQRVEKLIADLSSDATQMSIAKASDIISERMAAGKTVGIAAATHITSFEVFNNMNAPWKPLYVIWKANTKFKENLNEGDLLFWMHFTGFSSPLEDYGKCIREAKLDFITCFATDPNPENNAPDALAHIEQHWQFGDSEVPVPFPPGKMAPVSGLDQGLLLRMVDDAVAERLEERAGAPRE